MEMIIDGYTTLIDEDDYERVMRYKWRVSTSNQRQGFIYFIAHTHTNSKSVTVYLHRYIMHCTIGDGLNVDHINHNTLDNRKSNLRLATDEESMRNRRRSKNNITGYKGVRFHHKKYQAQIKAGETEIHIGTSHDPVVCAHWYDMMAIKLHREFAVTNFPKEFYKQEDIEDLYRRVTSNISLTSTSGYRGVSQHTVNKSWVAVIKHNKIPYRLGSFKTPEEAARAYDKKARELLGDKAKLNFPEGEK